MKNEVEFYSFQWKIVKYHLNFEASNLVIGFISPKTFRIISKGGDQLLMTPVTFWGTGAELIVNYKFLIPNTLQ